MHFKNSRVPNQETNNEREGLIHASRMAKQNFRCKWKQNWFVHRRMYMNYKTMLSYSLL